MAFADLISGYIVVRRGHGRGPSDHSGIHGRPVVVDPAMPNKVLAGKPYASPDRQLTTGIRALDRIAMLEITWFKNQMRYMGRDRTPGSMKMCIKPYKILTGMGMVVFKRRRV